jgi:ubiquinone/menaquinone biosynthesis C-methylase UbiE
LPARAIPAIIAAVAGRAAGARIFALSEEVYDRHVGRYGPSLAAAFLDFARLPGGASALDVGCGPGALTLALAERGHPVAAIEPSEPFAEACRRRAPGADVRVGAAEELPFADAAFGAVLSQLVVNFLSDAPAALAEMRRVARPGATVAACVWDYAGGMTLLRSFWDAAVALDPAAAERDEGRIMRYCSPGELEQLWRSAGLKEPRTGELTARASYRDFDDLWSPFPEGVAPSGAYCASLAPERRAALREELRRRLGTPEGSFELSARAFAVAGRAA